MRYVLAFLALLLLVAFLPLLVAIAGWSKGHHHYIEVAKELAPLITPVVTGVSLVIAGFVAYTSWLSPFEPIVQARPAVLLLAQKPAPFNIFVYLTFFNEGATSGVVSDLLLEIEFPKGKAIMEPLVFAKLTETYRDLLQTTKFSSDDAEGPFTPIFLAGRAQVTKAVSFGPGFGASDFDMGLVEAGQHRMRLFARYDLAGELTEIGHATIIIEPDVLSKWKSGGTQASEFRHRDIDLKKLPRR